MKTAGVYIHIPFCIKKCLYCDFPSFAGMEEQYKAYKNALINELLYCIEMQEYEISTIYIGGGTPTVMPPLFLYEILQAVSAYRIASNAEITVEINPGFCMDDSLSVLKQTGVNRLSIGLQAWQDRLLKELGRIHSQKDFFTSYNLALRTGFSNINIDVMFSLPNQSKSDWCETLEHVTMLEPAHISVYGLTVEEETPFGRMQRENKLNLPDEDTDRAMYETAKKILAENNYNHYEISNFSKKDFQSRHNVNYWKRGVYFGFGLGAHSFTSVGRYHNTYDIKKYLAADGDRDKLTEDIIPLSVSDEMSETMFLGLRMLDGVRPEDFRYKFNVDIFSVYGDTINKLVRQGLLISKNGAIRLTSLGIDLSNKVFCEFI